VRAERIEEGKYGEGRSEAGKKRWLSSWQIGRKENEGLGGIDEKNQRKWGRKMGRECMQNLMHEYHAGTPTQVKVVISTWEAELNAKAANEVLPVKDWEPLLVDLRRTRCRQTLFR